MPYTQAMTFADIRDEVRALRFANNTSLPTDTQIERWINDRYAALWNADEWIFKYAKVSNLTVTAGSTTVGNLPTDLGIPIGFWRDDGYPLVYQPPRSFYNIYAASTDTGAPQFYTMFDQAITVGPTPSQSSSTFSMAYEKRLTNLTGDSDTPVIPAQHHYLLVSGALSLGSRLMNDFTWEFHEQGWQQGIEEMRKDWLVDQRGEVTVWGRDSVEALPTAWGV